MYMKDKERVIRVRVSKEQFEKLCKLSQFSGFSVSELIRQAVSKL